MRSIDDLTPSEQAKIAANIYVAMTADDDRPVFTPVAQPVRGVRVTRRMLFVAYTTILLPLFTATSATTQMLSENIYFATLLCFIAAALFAALFSSLEYLWLVLASWICKLLDRYFWKL
jgi:hypothetical protein